MKTILIPVDESVASNNALQFAANLISGVEAEQIILINSYYVSLYAQVLPSADFVQLSSEDIRQEYQNIRNFLDLQEVRLMEMCNSDVKIKSIISDQPISRAIHETIEEESVDLLILGSDDAEGLKESLIGRHLIAITKSSPIPVLIIPTGVRFSRLERALVPFNYSTIANLQRLNNFKNERNWLNLQLSLLNVNPQQKELLNAEGNLGRLKDMLADYEYQVYHTEKRNVIEGILQFAKEHVVDLIIALPGKHSFFYNLTHLSISEAITLNSKQPVLVLK